METLTAAEACDVLGGIAGTTLATLRETGVLNGEKVGRTILYDLESVEALANAKPPPNEPAWVVRLGRPDWDDEENRPLGWGPDALRSRQQNADAARQWWRVASPTEYIGEMLVATVSEWCVGAWRITGGQTKYGLSAFEVVDDPDATRWVGTRFPIKRGPVVLHWPRPERN